MQNFITLLFCLLFSLTTLSAQSDPTSNIPKGLTTEISFEQSDFNFGTIQAGERVKNVFEFTNTGDEPLIISNAKGSCGCTVPEWPKHPIAPGESSYLLVVFDSKNKKGNQAKRVTIVANTDPAMSFLNIRGTITEKIKPKEILNPQSESSEPLAINFANNPVDPDFFKIYPNPTVNQVNIALNQYAGEAAVVEFYDSMGRIMAKETINEVEEKSYSFSLENYQPGIYTASIVVGDKMRLAKQFVVSN